MAPQAWTTNTTGPNHDPAAYQVDDLIIDLAPRRVRRAGTVIRLQALSFDLLVTLVRAAPSLLSFDQLSERVWPGLVVTPETIVQRVKLLRNALGDDPHAPRYIEGVRGRGYRMVAEVRPLPESQGALESIALSSLTDAKQEQSPSVHAGIAAAAAVTMSSRSGTPPALPRAAGWGPLGWIGGTLLIVGLLAVSWAIVHYREVSKPADQARVVVSPVIHSLVVLPLENLSGDKEQEYFADGMTDALTTDLAQIGSLRVISRTSAMHFKDTKETLREIGRDLQVDAVVEGAVMRGENRLRVTAQLVEASSDHHLWAKTYERDLKDILALQDEIAQDITEQVRVKLSPRERGLFIPVHTVDPEAYDAALRGWYWLNRFIPGSTEKALDYFQRAIAKDPNYALAYAGLAYSFLAARDAGELPSQEPLPKAREAIAKALALDPSIAQAHAALGLIKFNDDWDFPGAEAEYRRAITLSPNFANAHQHYAIYLVAMNRVDEATTEIERAQELDPFSPAVNFWVGQVLYHARRYDDALRQIRRCLEMRADDLASFWAMADVYEQKKMFAEAFAARQQALVNDPRVTALVDAYKRSGYTGYLLKQAQFEQAHDPAYAAHIYALLNDEPSAIAALQAAYDKHATGMLFVRTAPELDSIRSSPRFRDLVGRMGFPPSPSDKN